MIIFPIMRPFTCRKGAQLLIRGDYDPTAPTVSVIRCPVHGDKIVIPAGWPRRRWYYVRTVSEGAKAPPYSPQYLRFHREEKGAEATKAREYRRRHRIR